MGNFYERIKDDLAELRALKTSAQKSASGIEFVTHKLNISVATSQEYARVLVKITPLRNDIIWSATIDKLSSGNQTYEAEEFFDESDYYVYVYFGGIIGGSANTTLTVIATDDFSMEIIENE